MQTFSFLKGKDKYYKKAKNWGTIQACFLAFCRNVTREKGWALLSGWMRTVCKFQQGYCSGWFWSLVQRNKLEQCILQHVPALLSSCLENPLLPELHLELSDFGNFCLSFDWQRRVWNVRNGMPGLGDTLNNGLYKRSQSNSVRKSAVNSSDQRHRAEAGRRTQGCRWEQSGTEPGKHTRAERSRCPKWDEGFGI